MVTLWLVDKRWEIQDCETAGPQCHRSGFCEVVSSEYTTTSESVDEEHNKVMDIIQRLS